jgi:hypothetical protein
MAIPGAPSDSPNPIGDLFGGVNRPQLNAFVANSQARNGLVSAQTQEAMTKASQAQEQMTAWDKIHDALIQKGYKSSDADLVRAAIVGASDHSAENALKALGLADLGSPQSTQPEQALGQQLYKGEGVTPPTVPNNFLAPPGGMYAGAVPQQTAQGAAQTAQANALTGLTTHKDTDPTAFRASMYGSTPPEGVAALNNAVREGRIDPMRLNARTAPIYAQMELATPGTNFNRLHADATLQANPTFQQKAMSVDMLPGLLANVTSLGKKVGYNDVQAVGKMQQWLNGQLNDPAFTEYMTARNDTMMRLASVMRGVGMSDKSIEMENEVARPTLNPASLDAWLKGQMSVVQPLWDRQNRVTHLGEPGMGTPPAGATPAAGPAGPTPLGETVPSPYDQSTTTGILHYPNEAAARAAGHKSGERVFLEDHGTTGKLD